MLRNIKSCLNSSDMISVLKLLVSCFMNRMKWLWLGFLFLVSLLFWFSLNEIERTIELWALRKSLLYYGGVVSMAMMSFGMILSLRLRPLENLTNGLDRSYRLHKWLGITGGLFALLHWFIKVEPKALIKQGWVSAQTFATPTGTMDFFSDPNPLEGLKGIAKATGEWTIYILVVLLLIALLQKVSYRNFFRSHQIMPIIYLALVFHSTVLLGKLGWASPIGITMGILMAAGSIAAVVALTGRIAASKRFEGKVIKHSTHPADRVTEVEIQMGTDWPGHTTGQFAFVTFDQKEGAHPFTLASNDTRGHTVRLYIKQLGDYTRTLDTSVHIGQKAIIEGPYGRFSFEPANVRQIWIAGGVGITPFISRLEYLSDRSTPRPDNAQKSDPDIDLYLCVKDQGNDLVDKVRTLARHAHVRLHVISSAAGQMMKADLITQTHLDWPNAHFWFCGPGSLGSALRTDLIRNGLPARQFHQELFEMR